MDSDITVQFARMLGSYYLLILFSLLLLLLLLTFFQSILQNVFHGLDLGSSEIWVCVT